MNSWSNIKVAVLIPNYMVSGHLIFSLLAEKFVKKFSPIFHFQKLKSVQICNFLGENFQNLHFLGWNFCPPPPTQIFSKNINLC